MLRYGPDVAGLWSDSPIFQPVLLQLRRNQPIEKLLAETAPDATAPPAASGSAETDREALVALYNATDGENWDRSANWLSDAPLGEWEGVTTDDDGRVTRLQLDNNKLSWEIPAELGSLSNLEWLSLRGSFELSGEIPAELGSLSNLEWLSLRGSFELSGEIPAELGSLSNLTYLDLSHNFELSGEIPAELGSLPNLERLLLGGNELSGEIPAELGSLSNLSALSFYDNELSGEIPAELGSLSNLTSLNLSDNDLSGEFPPELGSLSNLIQLGFKGNDLSGCVPSSLEDQLTTLLGFGNLPRC